MIYHTKKSKIRQVFIDTTSVTNISFAKWFKLRRILVDATQSEIAKELGVRSQTISNWENGISTPSLNPEQTLKLCSILRVSLEDLVKGFLGKGSLDKK